MFKGSHAIKITSFSYNDWPDAFNDCYEHIISDIIIVGQGRHAIYWYFNDFWIEMYWKKMLLDLDEDNKIGSKLKYARNMWETYIKKLIKSTEQYQKWIKPLSYAFFRLQRFRLLNTIFGFFFSYFYMFCFQNGIFRFTRDFFSD